MKFNIQCLGSMGEKATLRYLAVCLEHFSFKVDSQYRTRVPQSPCQAELSPKFTCPHTQPYLYSHTQGKHGSRENTILCKYGVFLAHLANVFSSLVNVGEPHCLLWQSSGWSSGAMSASRCLLRSVVLYWSSLLE